MKDLLNDKQCDNNQKKTIFFVPANDDARKTYFTYILKSQCLIKSYSVHTEQLNDL